MSYWNAKYTNDYGEYEITFASKNREVTKAVEKVCCAAMDGLVEEPDDVQVGYVGPCDVCYLSGREDSRCLSCPAGPI